MTVMFHLWRKASQERNDFGRQVAQLRLELAAEKQQHAAARVALAQPCERCVVLEDERDTALLQLDAVQATLYWLERDFRVAG